MNKFKVTIDVYVEAETAEQAKLDAEWHRLSCFNQGCRKGTTYGHKVTGVDQIQEKDTDQ